MPRVGSSSSSTFGSVASHLASTTFCWLPPLRLRTALAAATASSPRSRSTKRTDELPLARRVAAGPAATCDARLARLAFSATLMSRAPARRPCDPRARARGPARWRPAATRIATGWPSTQHSPVAACGAGRRAFQAAPSGRHPSGRRRRAPRRDARERYVAHAEVAARVADAAATVLDAQHSVAEAGGRSRNIVRQSRPTIMRTISSCVTSPNGLVATDRPSRITVTSSAMCGSSSSLCVM